MNARNALNNAIDTNTFPSLNPHFGTHCCCVDLSLLCFQFVILIWWLFLPSLPSHVLSCILPAWHYLPIDWSGKAKEIAKKANWCVIRKFNNMILNAFDCQPTKKELFLVAEHFDVYLNESFMFESDFERLSLSR